MNPPTNPKIDNLSKLRLEKYKLSTYCAYQEKLIGLKIRYLKENFPSVIGESFLPYDKAQNVQVSGLLDTINDFIIKLIPGVFKGKSLPGIVLKIVQILLIRVFHKSRTTKTSHD